MKAVANGFLKVTNVIYKACKTVSLVLLVATILLLFVATVLRYCFNITLSWAEELCRYMVVWFSFLISGIGIRDNIHVGFDLIKDRIPQKLKTFWTIMLNVLTFGVSFVLLTGGLAFVKQTSKQTSASLGFPMSFVYAALLVGAILFALFSLESIVKVMVKEK